MKYAAHEFAFYKPSIHASAVTDATTNGTSVDTKGYRECLVVFDARLAAANAEGDVHVEESSDDSTFTDVSSAVFVQVTPTNDVTYFVMRINLETTERYLRCVLETDGSNAFTGAMGFILSDKKYGPVSQTQTAINA